VPTINASARRIRVKIVYYGAGLSGKTTNLEKLHLHYPSDNRGDMVVLDTESERTLFFDYFPAHLGKLGGLTLQVDFFTVPGQSFYNTTRTSVLRGVDGIVFVADSHPDREVANEMSLDNLETNLNTLGRRLDDIPLVFQWNKRDLDNAIPVSVLSRQLNRRGAPEREAIAVQGTGVWETQKLILSHTIEALKRQFARKRGLTP